MITRTTKYTASDGTEHDSPQAAAQHDFKAAITSILRDGGLIDEDWSMDAVTELARNPEALRDALDAYFEDLEAHLDVEVDHLQRAREIVDSWPTWKRNYRLTEHSPDVEAGDPVVFDEGDIESVSICKDGEWQHFDVSEDGTFTTDLTGTFHLNGEPDDPSTWRVEPQPTYEEPRFPWDRDALERHSKDVSEMLKGKKPIYFADGEVRYKAADRFTVDHPQYCRPFGTRED